jgi:hypothetical protein
MKTSSALTLLAFIAAAINIGCVVGLEYLGHVVLADENGPLEMLQVLFTCLAIILFCAAAFKSARPQAPLYSAIALTFFTFLIRELDLRKLDLPGILTHIASGPSERLFIAFGVICILALLVIYRMELINAGLAYIPTLPGMLIVAGAVFLVGGAVFDKELIDTPFFRLYEEWLEFNGYFLLSFAGFLALKQS